MADRKIERKPLRVWPGAALVAVQWLGVFAVPALAPQAAMAGMLVGLAATLGILLWWLFFSRAPWTERLAALGLMVAALAVTPLVLHESIATGAMGMLFYLHALPGLCLAFVAWAAVAGRLSRRARWAAMVVTIFAACGVWALVRTGGFTGSGNSDFAWRWSPTAEDLLMAREADDPTLRPPGRTVVDEPLAPRTAEPPARAREELQAGEGLETSDIPAVRGEEAAPAAVLAAIESAVDWPGFRGPQRDGVVPGARVASNWSVSPPIELWRRPIGPGWSSFAVAGDRLYTQEQRGDDELVACYRLETGEPVWQRRDAARFWESNAGAGPRATPTLHGGWVYSLGATGILNALDAADGSLVWSRNAAHDTGVEVPDWGFASSPLVTGELVVVATGGRLIAYERATGEPRWLGPEGGWGYASPQLVTIDGGEQIVLLDGKGAIGLAPDDGGVLWEHAWPGDGILQPAITADGDLLIGTGSGMGSGAGLGIRRIEVSDGPAGWSVEERWTSTGLKPYFNDFVVHDGHAFGFDGAILAAVDLADGTRAWKGGRYGHGQLVLLPEQDLLLVLSEQGELALVAARPEAFEEIARVPAIEGKTWNHPVLVGDILLVRNGREMAAFRLARPAG